MNLLFSLERFKTTWDFTGFNPPPPPQCCPSSFEEETGTLTLASAITSASEDAVALVSLHCLFNCTVNLRILL